MKIATFINAEKPHTRLWCNYYATRMGSII